MHSLSGQFLRFAAVGVAGFVVNAGLVELLARWIGPIAAQGIAFPAAVTVTWWLNRKYTFGASGRPLHREWLHYSVANAFGWLANNGVYFWMVLGMEVAYRHPVLAVAAGSVAGMFFNFASSRWLVFRR